MLSFHYKVNFESDVTFSIMAHKKWYELLLNNEHVLIVDFMLTCEIIFIFEIRVSKNF
jgi:hypothetical protein